MRGQSHVVGFALVLGIGIVALGTLTAGIGAVIDGQSSNADAMRVAEQMDDAMQVVERTGVYTHRITFAEGSLGTTERTLRVLEDGEVEHEIDVDALVFETGERRVTGVAGAVVHGTDSSAWLERTPPITSSEANEVLVVGAPVLGADHVTVSGHGGVTVTLQTNITHERESLGTGTYAVAIETKTPEPFERYFEEQNADVERVTFDGDEYESVVATYPGERTGYLVVHGVSMEVNDG